jgi:hypothetical protein
LRGRASKKGLGRLSANANVQPICVLKTLSALCYISEMILTILSRTDLEQHTVAIEKATEKAFAAIASAGRPVEALRRMKFEQLGFHPIDERPLNLIEQINQTFTFLVALKATEWLLERHPEAHGFRLSPGATMALPLDIMSVEPDLVGAETFAATHPDSNRKLLKDLKKLRSARAKFRYAFFYSPGFAPGRLERLERETGIEVHCVDI